MKNLVGGARTLALLCLVCTTAACGQGNEPGTPAASVAVELSRDRIALGSPVDITYRYVVAENAPELGVRRVFVHFVDADEELMWTDDHEPPTPTSAWRPGQTVEYTRTLFVPVYPYVGPAKIVLGVFDPATNDRLRLGPAADRGDRSYEVASFELLPQTENVFLIFKDGWHPVESAVDNAAVEWQWTRKEATLAFRNPRRDAVLFLQVDNPSQAADAARSLDVRLGDQTLATVPADPADAPIRRIPLPAAQLGAGDTVELRLVADRTFVPALEPGATSNDTRELGVRVFHAFVQPQ